MQVGASIHLAFNFSALETQVGFLGKLSHCIHAEPSYMYFLGLLIDVFVVVFVTFISIIIIIPSHFSYMNDCPIRLI
jgi:hypothetical protein